MHLFCRMSGLQEFADITVIRCVQLTDVGIWSLFLITGVAQSSAALSMVTEKIKM